MSIFGVILVRIFPTFSHIWIEYGEIRSISPYAVRMRLNAGKMRTRIAPNTDTFYAVFYFFVAFTVLVVFKTLGCFFPIFKFDWYVCWFFVFSCIQFWYLLHAIKTNFTIFLNAIMHPWMVIKAAMLARTRISRSKVSFWKHKTFRWMIRLFW